MMLSDFASNVYSYSGEDGMIAELVEAMGLFGVCVEFGAWDGVESSNTALLREAGWETYLIEGDEEKFEELTKLESDDVHCHNFYVTPAGGLDELLAGVDVALMSIDIDGGDYHIFESMQTAPTIVIIEYNQTVPWFLDVRGKEFNNRFGASALSLNRLAVSKGYSLVGATETNLIFVLNTELKPVLQYACPYEQIMMQLPMRFGITVTNYTCDPYELNYENLPKWGWRSSKPRDELVFGELLYPGRSKAISERFKSERV